MCKIDFVLYVICLLLLLGIDKLLLDMEEVEFVEDGEEFSCGHCMIILGTWTQIIENYTIREHICFTNSNNVQIHFETKHIFRSENCEKVVPSLDHTSHMSVKHLSCSSSSSTSNPRSLKAVTDVGSNSQTNRSEDYWTDAMVQLLISSYNNHKCKFDSPLYNKKKVFEVISNDLLKHGYNKSGLKCDEKWRNLKKTYDKVRNENSKTGNSKTSWKYFDDFQNIYWHDPHFNPLKTVSSTGKVSSKGDSINFAIDSEEKSGEKIACISGKRKIMEEGRSSVTSNEDEKEDTENQIQKTPKRKNLSPGEKVRCNRTISTFEVEQRKQKRHDEKMQLKREMFDWFKQSFKK